MPDAIQGAAMEGRPSFLPSTTKGTAKETWSTTETLARRTLGELQGSQDSIEPPNPPTPLQSNRLREAPKEQSPPITEEMLAQIKEAMTRPAHWISSAALTKSPESDEPSLTPAQLQTLHTLGTMIEHLRKAISKLPPPQPPAPRPLTAEETKAQKEFAKVIETIKNKLKDVQEHKKNKALQYVGEAAEIVSDFDVSSLLESIGAVANIDVLSLTSFAMLGRDIPKLKHLLDIPKKLKTIDKQLETKREALKDAVASNDPTIPILTQEIKALEQEKEKTKRSAWKGIQLSTGIVATAMGLVRGGGHVAAIAGGGAVPVAISGAVLPILATAYGALIAAYGAVKTVQSSKALFTTHKQLKAARNEKDTFAKTTTNLTQTSVADCRALKSASLEKKVSQLTLEEKKLTVKTVYNVRLIAVGVLTLIFGVASIVLSGGAMTPVVLGLVIGLSALTFGVLAGTTIAGLKMSHEIKKIKEKPASKLPTGVQRLEDLSKLASDLIEQLQNAEDRKAFLEEMDLIDKNDREAFVKNWANNKGKLTQALAERYANAFPQGTLAEMRNLLDDLKIDYKTMTPQQLASAILKFPFDQDPKENARFQALFLLKCAVAPTLKECEALVTDENKLRDALAKKCTPLFEQTLRSQYTNLTSVEVFRDSIEKRMTFLKEWAIGKPNNRAKIAQNDKKFTEALSKRFAFLFPSPEPKGIAGKIRALPKTVTGFIG